MSVSHTPAAMAAAAKPTRVRFGIMVLLFITVVINYLDRSNLSIAAPAMAGAAMERLLRSR